MMKPNTALSSAAINEAPNVSRYDASARGSVAMSPELGERQARAA